MELFNFSFFSITGQGIDLDYHDIEWFALDCVDHNKLWKILKGLVGLNITVQRQLLQDYCLGHRLGIP